MRIRSRLKKIGLFTAIAFFIVMRWKLTQIYQNQGTPKQPAETQERDDETVESRRAVRQGHSSTILLLRDNQLACNPAREIVYLKTHKTGSSTLMRILQRHVQRYKLTEKVMEFPFPFYGGYPGRLRKEFCFGGSFNMSQNHQKKASVLMGHFRFQEQDVKEVMSPNARYISIMRNPLKAFESSFHYYYENQSEKRPPFYIRTMYCPGFPYIHVLKKVGMNFSEFLSVVSPSTILESPWGFRAKNYQAYDFGLDSYNESVEYVLAEAKKLDKTFDLVLILEHLLESLVLLKDILCMEWNDIVPEFEMAGSYIPQQLNARERSKMDQLTTQDRILYNYFNKSLWEKIEKYGRERMKTDVEKLKRLGGLTGRKSIYHNQGRGSEEAIASVTFEASGEENKVSDLERRLEKAYPQKQIDTVKDKQFFYKFADHMISHSGWCPRVYEL